MLQKTFLIFSFTASADWWKNAEEEVCVTDSRSVRVNEEVLMCLAHATYSLFIDLLVFSRFFCIFMFNIKVYFDVLNLFLLLLMILNRYFFLFMCFNFYASACIFSS